MAMHVDAVQNAQAISTKEKEKALRASISNIIADLECPFNVPIEMYLSVRELAVALPAFGEFAIDGPDNIMKGIFEPVREDLSRLIYASLGTTVLNASFAWAYLGQMILMPTVFIDIPPGTVADWADLESRVRKMLGRATSTLGFIIDVQFQIIH
ncbi:hypothetical protein UA08_03358 [Talaromyces atroroseus]|uniref:Uncharacterized protein n=1 Tax=Talaromyces atroroseus TaxID=1441469 RepID=A0A225B3B8_TALAT|nr:hypothetical protein UA08_03358 [Talaromyces atroroseus]OKL61315.1 hypothetical protein UA08_03358 [Talaromyces atroroseus]